MTQHTPYLTTTKANNIEKQDSKVTQHEIHQRHDVLTLCDEHHKNHLKTTSSDLTKPKICQPKVSGSYFKNPPKFTLWDKYRVHPFRRPLLRQPGSLTKALPLNNHDLRLAPGLPEVSVVPGLPMLSSLCGSI